MFISQHTYVNRYINIGSSGYEHRFIFEGMFLAETELYSAPEGENDESASSI